MIVPPPRPGPGPKQVFNSKIVRIRFPQSIGGLVYIRVTQMWEGDYTPIPPLALVTGLPWPDFNMFDGLNFEDPTDLGKVKGVSTVAIVNPVTDDMLTKYRHWNQSKPVHLATTKTAPPTTVTVVDLASYTLIYNHQITGRQHTLSTRQQALDYFKGPGLQPGQDPNLVGVGLFENDGSDITIPSARFYQIVAEAGWTYHEEVGPPSTLYTNQDVCNVLFNLGKLFRDVPKTKGKTPATFTFRINAPTKTAVPAGNAGANLRWTVQAAAWKSALTKPPAGPKSDERRSFPVKDVSTPVSGNPGQFSHEYNVADFPFPDSEMVAANKTTTGGWIDCKITFGAAKVAPKVELTDHGVISTGGVG